MGILIIIFNRSSFILKVEKEINSKNDKINQICVINPKIIL